MSVLNVDMCILKGGGGGSTCLPKQYLLPFWVNIEFLLRDYGR